MPQFKTNIRKFIEEAVRLSLVEQNKEPAPAEPPTSPKPTSSETDDSPADTSFTSDTPDSSMDGGVNSGELDAGSSLIGGDALSGDGGPGDGGGDLSDDGSSDLGGFDGGGGGGFPTSGGGGGGSFGGSDDSSGDGEESSEESSTLTPEGEPEKNPEDPLGAAMNEAEKVAKETTDPQKILNAMKASIQVNFSNYRDAWPLISRLKQTENKTLQAVASRLALFIADVLQEEKAMSKIVGKQNVKTHSKENKHKESKTLRITEQQLRAMIREAVRSHLKESSNYVENERMRQEVNMLALEFLEKLTQKLSIDPSTLSPEALASYKHTHKQLEVAVRTAASELFQLGAVLKAAGSTGAGDKS